MSGRSRSDMGEGSSRPPKLARTKAACTECHKVKQRCDGVSPCHRCKLWGFQCIFPPPKKKGKASGRQQQQRRQSQRQQEDNDDEDEDDVDVDADSFDTPAAHTAVSGLHNMSTPSHESPDAATAAYLANLHPAFQDSAGPAAASNQPVFAQQAPMTSNAFPPLPPMPMSMQDPFITILDQLRFLNERISGFSNVNDRLSTIEAQLARGSTGHAHLGLASGSQRSGHSPNASSGQTGVRDSSHREARAYESNAVDIAGEAMAVQGLVGLAAPSRQQQNGDTWDAHVKPDIVDRKLLTEQECEDEFNLFYEKIFPWSLFLSTTQDRSAMAVRARSPLLFTAIILTTLYYRAKTPQNLALYRAVSSIFDSQLSPQILCPQPDQLSPDFVRALYLVLLYKPIQYTALHAKGVNGAAEAEHASKVNVRASWMIRGLVTRVSSFIGLTNACSDFEKAYGDRHYTTVSSEVTNDQRLFFGWLWTETHGALQSGRAPILETSDALRTTRLFAEHAEQPTDVRLAACVELSVIAATFLHGRRNDELDTTLIETFDSEMAAWRKYWEPILIRNSQDKLSRVAIFPYATFVQVVVNGFAYTRWKAEMRAHKNSKELHSLRPSLSDSDLNSIGRAVKAIEQMVLAVTEQGKHASTETDFEFVWSQSDLALDREACEHLKWASDSINCVVYSFALIMLAKLVNDGIIKPDLSISETFSSTTPTVRFDAKSKIAALLDLGAQLLAAIAPNGDHPAVRQGLFLQRLREAGITGRRGFASAPGSPRAGASSATTYNGSSGALHPPTFPTSVTSTVRFGDTYDSASKGDLDGQTSSEVDALDALLNGISPSLFEGAQAVGGNGAGLEATLFDWDVGAGGTNSWSMQA